jgi:uracil-DNA glycosylase
MSMRQPVRHVAHHAVSLPEPDDFGAWRDRARTLVQCGIRPEQVSWSEPGASGGLFGSAESDLPASDANAPWVRASKPFLELAQSAILHADPERLALLYRLLWRLQSESRIMEDRADRDVRRLDQMARSVRRDMHKMRAFVRFRAVGQGEAERFIAWFEPEHRILRANAGFFVRRFASMRWSILTPKGSLHWDGEALGEGPPAQRCEAPDGDPAEELWRRYYASIFNPARLKVGAMLREMPRKYWKNMPETALIPELVAGAQARESAMVEAGAIEFGERPRSLSAIDEAIHACRRCPIGLLENSAVMGEGAKKAELMIVGEQPGDQEDLAGRPFVGPAGKVLDAHLERTGIDRRRVYLTNAVKHFKYVQRGKRRLHQSPTAREIDICRFWLEGERAIVKPRLLLALGSSAARGLLGKTVSISQVRGQPHALADGSELWVTVHPSYLLRLRDEARDEQERMFQADLAAVAERLAELAG